LSKPKKIDNKKIEKAAVLFVKQLIQQCDCLDDKILTEDKNILDDGTIDVYRSPEESTDSIIGKIAVQVKGTTSQHKEHGGYSKFSVSTEALKKYNEVYQGILFIYVVVDKSTLCGERAYFAQLLPYDIARILSQTNDDQKTVAVRFRRFPDEPHEITRLVGSFLANRKKQLRAKVSGYGLLDEGAPVPSPGIRSISFSMQLFPGESLTTIAGLDNEYLYGEDSAGSLVVWGKIENLRMIARGTEAEVSSGNFRERILVFVGHNEDGRYLEFEGASIVIRKDHQVTLNYSISGFFHKRYYTALFVHEFLQTGEMRLNGETLLLVVSKEEKELSARLVDTVNACEPFVRTLDALGIEDCWDPSRMSDREIADIRLMKRLLVDKEILTDLRITSPIVHFDIQGSRVYALAHETESGGYEFVDLMSDRLFFVFGWKHEGPIEQSVGFDPVPALVIIGKEGFKRITNLSSSKFKLQLDRFPVTAGNWIQLNQKLLEMLAAYDEGAQRAEELLACATLLAGELHDFDRNSETSTINLLQTIRRSRELTENERGILQDIALDGEQMSSKAAAFALLGNSEMAHKCLNRCTDEERSQIQGFPIAAFFIE
jgi:hypothetical protein